MNWRWRSCAAAVALVSLLVLPSRWSSAIGEHYSNNQKDFAIFYATADCLFRIACDDPYAVVQGLTSNLVPPHAHVLFAPFLAFPVQTAYVGWQLFSALVLAGAGAASARALAIRLSWLGWTTGLLALAASGLTMATLASGQIYAVLTWAVTAGWLAWRQDRPPWAGFWIGLAASVKPPLLVIVAWWWLNGHRRAAYTAMATGALALGVGCLALGAGPFEGWLRNLAGAPLEAHFRDGSILNSLVRQTVETAFMPPFSSDVWVRPLWAVLAGLVLMFTALRPAPDRDRRFLNLLVAALLAAPKGWLYAGWWLVAPAAAVWMKGSGPIQCGMAIAAAALWLPDTAPLWGQPNPWLTPTWGSLYFWVWALLWLVTLDLNERPSRPIETSASSAR
jgi:hypothetical protein